MKTRLKLTRLGRDFILLVIVLLIGALVAILWFYGERLNMLWNANNFNNNQLSANINIYLQDALKGLYPYQPATDPLQKRVYFPEANFYVPMNESSRKLVYSYNPAAKDLPEELMITASANLSTPVATFADVPCLQRHITVIVNSQDNPDGQFITSAKLNDGRTLYIYQHQEGNCSNLKWSYYSANDIIGLLEQAQSY